MTTPSQSAGIIIVRKGPQGCRYLLLRAYSNWDFPKGMIEAGEDAVHAACREVEEETGLRDLKFSWGNSYKETRRYGPPSKPKIARYYIAEVDTRASEPQVTLPVSQELGRPENDEYRWVSYREALNILPPRLVSIIKWAHQIIEAT